MLIICLTNFGIMSSVMNIAQPTPKGSAIIMENKEVIIVPYIAVNAP